jgi:salicylate hydroxylase
MKCFWWYKKLRFYGGLDGILSSLTLILSSTTTNISATSLLSTRGGAAAVAFSRPLSTTTRSLQRGGSYHFPHYTLGRLSLASFGCRSTMDSDDHHYHHEYSMRRHASSSPPPLPRLCPKCQGEGKIFRPPSRKARLRHQKRIKTQQQENDGDNDNNNNNNNAAAPTQMPPRWDPCPRCTHQSGLLWEPLDDDDVIIIPSATVNLDGESMVPQQQKQKQQLVEIPNHWHVAIIGGGIGGLALAVALRHRHISCRVYEKDHSFEQRRQGYGLTLQQARRALLALGIRDTNYHHHLNGGIDDEEKTTTTTTETDGDWFLNGDAVTSTKHVVHTIDGTVVGEWGLRKWGRPENKRDNGRDDGRNSMKKKSPKRQNLHVPRQTLRRALWEALQETSCSSREDVAMSWGHKLIDIQPKSSSLGNCQESLNKMQLTFQVASEDGNVKTATTEADLVVGCDGIRSAVREFLLGQENDSKTPTPLRYLDCIVILGICRLDLLDPSIRQSPLLDGETVFQTADGTTRIYLMPYSKKNNEYMWQLSFPVSEDTAKEWSCKGSAALKQEALNKCKTWHEPIPEILQQTPVDLVSGYPVYDRDLLGPNALSEARQATMTGKWPGMITLLGDACHPMSPFKGQGANQALLDALSLARLIHRLHCRQGKPLPEVLEEFEQEMIERSSRKVKASSDAAQFLHSDIAILTGDVTRGGAAATVASTVRAE